VPVAAISVTHATLPVSRILTNKNKGSYVRRSAARRPISGRRPAATPHWENALEAQTAQRARAVCAENHDTHSPLFSPTRDSRSNPNATIAFAPALYPTDIESDPLVRCIRPSPLNRRSVPLGEVGEVLAPRAARLTRRQRETLSWRHSAQLRGRKSAKIGCFATRMLTPFPQ